MADSFRSSERACSRREFLASAAAASPALADEKLARPNLIFFMPDELRAESLACYGHPLVKTPHFDRVAAEGVRFEQCHVQNTVCGPSRCSLMTGWPVHVRGHRSLYYDLHPDEPNLLRYLKDGGYDVYWYGKNDLLAPDAFPLSVTAWASLARHEPRAAESLAAIRSAFLFLPLRQTAGSPRDQGLRQCARRCPHS